MQGKKHEEPEKVSSLMEFLLYWFGTKHWEKVEQRYGKEEMERMKRHHEVYIKSGK